MTSQPTPNVTNADVDRIVTRDYAADQRARVWVVLREYGSEEWHPEIDRVRVAALKLAAGNLEHLRLHIDVAKIDYRDVIAAAEYPGYMKRIPPSEDVPPHERAQVIRDDWEQYEQWLTRHAPGHES
jgi:hypothetical protein